MMYTDVSLCGTLCRGAARERAIGRDKGDEVTLPTGTETAARVADVLLLFTDGPDSWGVSAIARELGLSKAVVHRTLQTLVNRRLLVADPQTRGYELGPASAALGARALRESGLRRAALPMLRELQALTGETTTVSALVPDGRVYLDQVESTREIKMTVEVGRRFPLYVGSSSTCILAFLPREQQDAVLQGPLESFTSQSVTDRTVLEARLEEIRRVGYAHSDGERQAGAGAVAAPVFGLDGSPVGAISVCGPLARFDHEARDRFVPHLLRASQQISRSLGWHGDLSTAALGATP